MRLFVDLNYMYSKTLLSPKLKIWTWIDMDEWITIWFFSRKKDGSLVFIKSKVIVNYTKDTLYHPNTTFYRRLITSNVSTSRQQVQNIEFVHHQEQSRLREIYNRDKVANISAGASHNRMSNNIDNTHLQWNQKTESA